MIKKFKSKKEIFDYVVKLFRKDGKVICVQGSTATKPVKKFSDIDVEVYSKKEKKPYYEIVFVKDKPILITVYYQKFVAGKKVKPPKNVKVLYGDYNDKIEPDFKMKKYKLKDKAIREPQLVTDFLFKYFRGKDKRYLKYVQKRLSWN